MTGEAGHRQDEPDRRLPRRADDAAERPIVARGRCSERLAGAEAYLPILEALDSLLHRAGGESLADA